MTHNTHAGRWIWMLVLLSLTIQTHGRTHQPEFSTAGFYALKETGRTAYSMNPAWRVHKGPVEGAEQNDFDDRNWRLVSLPDGIEYLPSEASGCVNYQGEVWYRKHFTPEESWRGRKLFLHFEAIMGKSKVWVNGEPLTEHYGGFLPVIADVTSRLKYGQDNVITVWADNSNDPSYPPGKAQDVLDFAYFGGIYRDCWMIVHNDVFITDPNYERVTAGGGLFVSFGKISEDAAQLNLNIHVRNSSDRNFSGKVLFELYDREGKLVRTAGKGLSVARGKAGSRQTSMEIERPHLWTPDSPYLYNLHVYIKDNTGRTIDGFRRRIGVRSIEFKGRDGFWLNGKPYPEPLIGANRHQDFAVIGNALPNSLHWRDAKKLRDAGLRVIRNAHYPQDPAFMDACDELGLFVIVNTPGWQFWNEEPLFAQRVYDDIRNMVRRDRNHPCVWMWEPILNETRYPEDFARTVVDIVNEEYPYPYCYCGCDSRALGHEHFKVQFRHPFNGGNDAGEQMEEHITYFTREWGDNVDDWNSHNSPSRVSRAWGEYPMLKQAQGYATLGFPNFTCYDILYRQSRQHVGGCLWHSFDHQRGYHPDPFYGGIMDAFRQPKLSYYMFMSQRPNRTNEELIAESGPMVYIANAMTPFSPEDVTIYSNCDEVRLTYCKNGRQYTYKKEAKREGMPSPVITFKDVWKVMQDKELSRVGKQKDSYLLAEGFVEGKLVATHKLEPTRRPSKLLLWTDDENVEMQADGSDIVTVVAAITDRDGRIKRLNNSIVKFEIDGPGIFIGNEETHTNPRPIQWGTAPILVRATTKPGNIKVRAIVTWEGTHTPIAAELIIPVKEATLKFVANETEIRLSEQSNKTGQTTVTTGEKSNIRLQNDEHQQVQNQIKLKEIEKQQSDFE